MEKTAYQIGFELALLNAGFTKEALSKDAGILDRLTKFLKTKHPHATDTDTYRKAMGGIVERQSGGAAKSTIEATKSDAEKMLARLRKPKAPAAGRKFDPSRHVTPPGK